MIVVLVGTETWRRKYVDWEIYSGLKSTKNNPRCGLLGILLPTYPLKDNKIDTHTIPPRLYDNCAKDDFSNNQRYANLYKWNTDPNTVSDWIDYSVLI